MSLTLEEISGVLFNHIADGDVHSGTSSGGGASSSELNALSARVSALETAGSFDATDYTNACSIIKYNLEHFPEVYSGSLTGVTTANVGEKFATILHNTLADLRDNDLTTSDVNSLIATYLQSHTATILADYISANTAVFDNVTAANFFSAVGSFIELIADSVSATDVASFKVTSNHLTIADAFITNAMIQNISASKLTTGTLNTSLINVASENNNLLIADGTITISDGTRVRVQIGEDANEDYNMVVRDAQGNVMWSALGLNRAAIKSAIIDDACVAAGANINASKINIASVINSLNTTGGVKTTATNIIIDANNQTLGAWLTTMETWKGSLGTRVTNAETSITAINGQLSTLVSQEDFTELETGYTNLSSQYSSLSQTVNGIDARVTSNTTNHNTLSNTVSGLSTAVTNVQNSVSSLSLTANGLDLRIDALEEVDFDDFVTTSDMTTARSQITTEINTAAGNLNTTLSASISSLSDDLSDLEEIVEGIEIPDTSALQGSITTLQNNYTTLNATVNGINTTVSGYSSTIADLSDNVDDLSDGVTSLGTRVTTSESNITNINTTMTGINTTLSSHNTRITTVEGRTFTDTATVQQMINSHTAEIEATADELLLNYTELVEDLDADYVHTTELNQWASFTAQGLDLGSTTSGMKVHVDNSQIQFRDSSNNALATLTANSFHAPNFTVNTSEYLQLGNYRFIPNADGSLVLRYISNG